MAELQLTIETDSPIGQQAYAAAMLSVFRDHPQWLPERFGTYEPLRQSFEDPVRFIEAWERAGAEGGNMAGFLFAKRKLYRGTAIWWPSGGKMSSVYFSLPLKSTDTERVRECLQIGLELFDAFNGQYGHLCTREEFWSKNITESWSGPDGRPEGGRAHGTDRTKHIPGVYWANLFGPAYTKFFGDERLKTAPAVEIRRTSASWLLLVDENPFEWASSEVTERERMIRDHLGAEAFFLLEDPERTTRAPVFSGLNRSPR